MYKHRKINSKQIMYLNCRKVLFVFINPAACDTQSIRIITINNQLGHYC